MVEGPAVTACPVSSEALADRQFLGVPGRLHRPQLRAGAVVAHLVYAPSHDIEKVDRVQVPVGCGGLDVYPTPSSRRRERTYEAALHFSGELKKTLFNPGGFVEG